MFEKCGLKDIFYRIFALKWCAIAMVAVITIVGCLGYMIYSSAKGGSVSNSTSAQLAYYVEAPFDENKTVEYDPNDSAMSARSNFIKTTEGLMKSKSVCKDIYDMLLEVYTEEEISANIGSIGLDWENYYKNLYTLDTETGSTIIIDVNAVTDEGIEVAATAIKAEMAKIALSFDTQANLNLYTESYVYATNGTSGGFSLSKKNIALILIIAIVLTLALILILAIFAPTINRGSDLGEYGVPFLGIICEKKIEISARIIAKLMQDKGFKKLAVATSHRKNKLDDLVSKLSSEIGKIDKDLEIVFAKSPCTSGEAFDACLSADAVIILERRGFSRHKAFAEMLNLLSNFDVKVAAGMLQ